MKDWPLKPWSSASFEIGGQKKDGNKRVKIGAELYEMARKIVLSSIKNKNPGISEEELKKTLKERMQQ